MHTAYLVCSPSCPSTTVGCSVPASHPASKPRPPSSSQRSPHLFCTDPCTGTAFQGWSLGHDVPCALVPRAKYRTFVGRAGPAFLHALARFLCLHAVESRGRTGRAGQAQDRAGQGRRGEEEETKQDREREGHFPMLPHPCLWRTLEFMSMSILNGHGPRPLSSSRAGWLDTRPGWSWSWKLHLHLLCACLCLCPRLGLCLCLCLRLRVRLRLHPETTYLTCLHTPAAPAVCSLCICNCGACP